MINLVDSSYTHQKVHYKNNIEDIISSYQKIADDKNIEICLEITD
jgi:hypothetical protein